MYKEHAEIVSVEFVEGKVIHAVVKAYPIEVLDNVDEYIASTNEAAATYHAYMTDEWYIVVKRPICRIFYGLASAVNKRCLELTTYHGIKPHYDPVLGYRYADLGVLYMQWRDDLRPLLQRWPLRVHDAYDRSVWTLVAHKLACIQGLINESVIGDPVPPFLEIGDVEDLRS